MTEIRLIHENKDQVKKISYTIGEAIIASGLSRAKIYQLLKSGNLLSRFVAGRRLILCVDLEKFITSASSDYASSVNGVGRAKRRA
ncbi:hypothetical protein [Methylocella silvestris]|uniref:Helix-turn-helix domain-containing protein n=1 Tax=Methylocella silvestris TaxID=199596 RepID=A0A2J7TLK8_METSI|nr:hypothetical protein [Methylocella silvestris]PNG27656.1 hypothetical protein CR492_01715 [Methylocella silvestris]